MASLPLHVMVAAFDIDRGSTLKAAHPPLPPWVDAARLPELMLPEGSHNRALETTLWIERPPASTSGEPTSSSTPVGAPAALAVGPLHCVSVCKTVLRADTRRGAEVRAVALACAWSGVDMLQPLVAALAEAAHAHAAAAAAAATASAADVSTPGADWVAFATSVHHAVAGLLDLSTFTHLSRLHRCVLRGLLPVAGKALAVVRPPPLASAFSGVEGDGAEVTPPDQWVVWRHRGSVQLTAGAPQLRVSMHCPLFVEPGVAHSASLSALLARFGAGIVTIYNAVLQVGGRSAGSGGGWWWCPSVRKHDSASPLTPGFIRPRAQGKRVLFLGTRDVAAVDVAAAVLACAHMVSPPLPGTALADRLFPYASLTDLSFLKVGGYVAGVTNPLFETKREWWDVLAVLEACDCEGVPMAHGSGLLPGSLAVVERVTDAPALPADPAATLSHARGEGGGSGSGGAGSDAQSSGLTGGTVPAVPAPAPTAAPAAGAVKKAPTAPPPQLKPSRVVTSSPSLFTAAAAPSSGVTDGSRPSAPASTVAAPAPPPVATRAPYLDLDDLFYERVESGRKYGEHWVRNAFEWHTASLLHLCTVAEDAAAAAAAAAVAGSQAKSAVGSASGVDTPTLWSPTAVTPSPTTGDAVTAHMAVLPPLHSAKSGPSAQQVKLVEHNRDRIAALQSTAVYVAWRQQRASEEEWLCNSSSVPEPISPLLLPPAVAAGSAAGAAGANACDVAELKALARAVRSAGGKLPGAAWDDPSGKEAHVDDASGAADSEPWVVPDPLPEGVLSTLTTLGVHLSQGPPPPVKPASAHPGDLRPHASDDLVALDPLALPPNHPVILFMRLAHHLRFPSAQLYWLSLFPDSSGGLHPIAAGLLHADSRVRRLADHILAGFAAHPWPPARKAVLGLNVALQLARGRG
jgi:hypothetical protein